MKPTDLPFRIPGICAAGLCLLLVGCATWESEPLGSFVTESTVPEALSCAECHEDQYATWKGTDHGDPDDMRIIEYPSMKECGGCHVNLTAHFADPDKAVPPRITEMTKSEQNTVCGKCHYNRDLFGREAINPHHRHGLLMSVGFEGYKRQISCLDCHEGHSERGDLVKSLKAHVCFSCHKEAIVTMGVFQPINYAANGHVCFGCHPVHGGSRLKQATHMVTGVAVTCLVCHPGGSFQEVGF